MKYSAINGGGRNRGTEELGVHRGVQVRQMGGGLGGLARTVYTSHRPPSAPSLLLPTNLIPYVSHTTTLSSTFRLLFLFQDFGNTLVTSSN
jgi:hypothetical protein